MRENEWEEVQNEIQSLLRDSRSILQESRELKGSFDQQFVHIHEELQSYRDELKETVHLLKQVLQQVGSRLTSIVIRFSQPVPQGASMSAPAGFVEGPITLTVAGQTVQAIVDGYDQFGNPMPVGFVLPTVTWTVDNAAFASIATNADGSATVTAVANGVSNVTAALTSTEGLSLSDVEAVTVAIPVTPPPTSVLSSVKIAFTALTAAAARR
jgi:hypothetical protein